MAKFSKERWRQVQDSISVYKLGTIVYFGKYPGATIRQMIEHDHRYVRYLIDECGKELDNEAFAYLERYE